jgi:putative CocE/NonD family hydrolase
MAPVKRSWTDFFVDRIFGWWCGLPGETCGYTVENLRIPIHTAADGSPPNLQLAANLYRPTTAKPHGTILIRTSYGISPMMALGSARLFAPRGYQVLLAACRGTDPDDGGELIPAVNEAADGLATVAWMKEQEWYTGSFGTYGGSYLGFTQWAILSEPPPDMKVAVIATGPHNFGAFGWGTGAMDAHLLAWADLMTAPSRGVTPGLAYIKSQPQVLKPVFDGVPMVDAIDEHFGESVPAWVKPVASDPTLSDPLFEGMDQSIALERANLPVLQHTGWNDMMMSMVIEQHANLTERRVPASLSIGPWSHLGSQRGDRITEGFKFIEEHLGGRATGSRKSPVRVFITGIKQWRDLSTWPPRPTSTTTFYLGPNKTLSHSESQSQSQSISSAVSNNTSSTFTFDPDNPTPNIAVPRPFDDVIPASYDDTSLCQRADVLYFTSPPLEQPLQICGRPLVQLHHASDNPHADLFIRLSEVDARGRSTRISDRYRRLDPVRSTSEPVTMELTDCAHVFGKGKRIRVIVAGGAHPAWGRNLGTGENQATGSSTRKVVHTIHYSAEAVSKISLPVTNV